MESTINKVSAGEARINDLRNRFVAELIMFSKLGSVRYTFDILSFTDREFDMPKAKLENLFESAIEDAKSRFI